MDASWTIRHELDFSGMFPLAGFFGGLQVQAETLQTKLLKKRGHFARLVTHRVERWILPSQSRVRAICFVANGFKCVFL